MIVATLTALFLLFGGGGSLEHYLLDLKKPVKAHVEDKDRASEILDLSKDLGKDLKKRNKRVEDLQEDFEELHTSFGASEADFQAAVDRMMEERSKGQQRILDTRDRMHDMMTPEEWQEVFGAS